MGVEPVRTFFKQRGRGSIFRDFVLTFFMTTSYRIQACNLHNETPSGNSSAASNISPNVLKNSSSDNTSPNK